MRKLHQVVCVAATVALSLVCAGWSGAEPETVPNELPRAWKLEEIAEATPPYGTKGRVYALAWAAVENDHANRLECCLALRVLDEDDGYGRWCLANLWRYPDSKEPKWQLCMTHVLEWNEDLKVRLGRWIWRAKRFKKKPDNNDLYAALGPREVDWKFEREGWKFIGCGVCKESWRAAISLKPTKFFKEPKELIPPMTAPIRPSE